MTMRLAVILSILLVVSMVPVFADERNSGVRHVKCVDLQKSILGIETLQVVEFDYTLVLSIEQNDGKCIMKNKLGKTYLVSWMPAYHVIKLTDMDFGEISSKRIMIPEQNETELFNLHNEIPYCVEVVSVWLDNRVRTESSSEICFRL